MLRIHINCRCDIEYVKLPLIGGCAALATSANSDIRPVPANSRRRPPARPTALLHLEGDCAEPFAMTSGVPKALWPRLSTASALLPLIRRALLDDPRAPRGDTAPQI